MVIFCIAYCTTTYNYHLCALRWVLQHLKRSSIWLWVVSIQPKGINPWELTTLTVIVGCVEISFLGVCCCYYFLYHFSRNTRISVHLRFSCIKYVYKKQLKQKPGKKWIFCFLQLVLCLLHSSISIVMTGCKYLTQKTFAYFHYAHKLIMKDLYS